MRKVQSRLTIALLFTALALLAFFATTFLSGMIDFLYRDATGLSTTRNVAQIAALLATVCVFITGFIVAISAALRPTSRLRKLLYVIPALLLLFTLVGIISAQIGVGTVGTLLNIQGVGVVNLATAWLAVGAVLSIVAVGIASARVKLGRGTLRSAVTMTGIGGLLTLVATVAMISSVAIVSASEPSGFGGRPEGQFNGGGQGAPAFGAPGQRPESTAEAPAGFTSGQNAGGVAGQPPAIIPEVSSGNDGLSGQTAGQQPATTSEAPSGFPNRQNGGAPPGGFPRSRWRRATRWRLSGRAGGRNAERGESVYRRRWVDGSICPDWVDR